MQAIKLSIYRHLPKSIQVLIRRTLFPTYLVAAKVWVTNDEGKFLAVKTTYGTGWDIPSGHCDRYESPTDAAARELWEETGIVASNLEHRAVIFQPVTGTVQVLFSATAAADSILKADNVEVSEVRWVTEGEVELNPFAREAIEIIDRGSSYYVSSLNH